MANAQMVLTNSAAYADELWNLEPVYSEARSGSTIQFITRTEKWHGNVMHRKAITELYTGARFDSNLEAAFPDSTKMAALDIEIAISNLRRSAAQFEISKVALIQMADEEHSAFDLAARVVGEIEADINESRNKHINATANARMATIAAKYKHDGDTYPGSSATSAFLQLKNGSTNYFHKGQFIDIRDVASTGTAQIRCHVTDVIHGNYLLGRNVGPGIAVAYDADLGYTSPADTDFDTIAADDDIVPSGETTSGYPAAFASLINFTSAPGAYFSVTDRAAAGYRWLIPNGKDYTTDSEAINLDVETHFGTMADLMAVLLPRARAVMANKGLKPHKAIVAQAHPALVAEFARQCGDATIGFQRDAASSLDAATRKDLIAVSGWDGAIYRSPNMPGFPIALQPEAQMDRNQIRLWDPNMAVALRLSEGNGKRPDWEKNEGGGIWHNVKSASGSTTQIVPAYQCGASIMETLFWENPQLIYAMLGLKSSLD